MRPPLQPWLPKEPAQSTNCCSERDTSLPEDRKLAPSREPVVEKAQHEPHWPWFFTGVTAPLVTQSTLSAAAACSASVKDTTLSRGRFRYASPPKPPTYWSWKSSHVMEENS